MRLPRLASLLVLAALALPSCAHYRARYDLLYIPDLAHAVAPKGVFEEAGVHIKWYPTENGFSFELKNHSKHSVRIFWEQSAYVDTTGTAHRVIHKGIRWSDINETEPPTVVPPGAYVDDMIIPGDHYQLKVTPYRYLFRVIPLLPTKASSETQLESYGQKYTGATVSLLLPIEIDGKRREYHFEFLVKTVWDLGRHVKLQRTAQAAAPKAPAKP